MSQSFTIKDARTHLHITYDEQYEFTKLFDILRDMDFELTPLQISVFEKITEGKDVDQQLREEASRHFDRCPQSKYYPEHVSLTVHEAEEVAESIKWIVDEAENMDADELETNKHIISAYKSIMQQLADNICEEQKKYFYPEPAGEPSY